MDPSYLQRAWSGIKTNLFPLTVILLIVIVTTGVVCHIVTHSSGPTTKVTCESSIQCRVHVNPDGSYNVTIENPTTAVPK